MPLQENLFQQSKNQKTVDLNVAQIVLFNSPRDSEQIGIMGRQLGERSTLLKIRKRATQEVFGNLVIFECEEQQEPQILLTLLWRRITPFLLRERRTFYQ